MSPSARSQQVGIDRLIRLKWLEDTTRLLLAGNDEQTIKIRLEELLSAIFPASLPSTRGSLSKTITILLKTWVKIPVELGPFRNDGLEILRRSMGRSNLIIHWGMITATYPFWNAVAAQVGRLLRLQGNVSAIQVQRRLREQYGERETVARRARYVLRAFIDWGLLNETEVKGLYSQGQILVIDDIQHVSWLIEALLYARPDHIASVKALIDNPGLFPFSIKPITTEQVLSGSSRLECLRQGIDEDILMLRKAPM